MYYKNIKQFGKTATKQRVLTQADHRNNANFWEQMDSTFEPKTIEGQIKKVLEYYIIPKYNSNNELSEGEVERILAICKQKGYSEVNKESITEYLANKYKA